MLTKEDKGWITENFATKDTLATVAKDVTELKVESALLQRTVQRLDSRMDKIETTTDKILTIVQSFAGNIADLEQENRMGAITLRRHDIQIHELAHVTGTTISE